MNNSEKSSAENCMINLTERLNKIRLETIQAADRPRPKSFTYENMVEKMLEKARENDRIFLNDVFDLILLYYTEGNNIDRLITKLSKSVEKQENLITMKNVYDIKKNCQFYECNPTLSRICEAFPQVSLVLTDMLIDNPNKIRLRLWVSNCDLGADVNHHFKMNYFPGLIDLEGFSFKAQVGLLLYNLCHAKAIVNSSPEKNIGAAFIDSCQISCNIIEQRPGPLEARKIFTKYIESLNLDSDLLCRVWNKVIGDEKIRICTVTLLTYFHEKVLKAQPVLDLQKWRELMDVKNSKN